MTPTPEQIQVAARVRAHCAYHQHNEQCNCRSVGCLTAFIADRVAALVASGEIDGRCDGCRAHDVTPWDGHAI